MASREAAAERAEQFPRLDVARVRAAFSSGEAEGWRELQRRHGDAVWLPSGLLLTIDRDIVKAMPMNRPHTEARPALYRRAGRFIPGADGLLFQTYPSGSARFSRWFLSSTRRI